MDVCDGVVAPIEGIDGFMADQGDVVRDPDASFQQELKDRGEGHLVVDDDGRWGSEFEEGLKHGVQAVFRGFPIGEVVGAGLDAFDFKGVQELLEGP